MRIRPRHILLRGSAAASLVAAAVLGTGLPSSAAEERPGAFGGQAVATGFASMLDSNPGATPVADLLHVDFPQSSGDLTSAGEISARAASMYPGGGLLGVPALVCFSAPQVCVVPPPDYPLTAEAAHPGSPDSATAYSGKVPPVGPVTAGAGTARAHADPDLVEAVADFDDTSLAGVLRAEDVSTRTKQHFEGATLVLSAETVVKGLSIADGVVKIDSIRSTAVGKVDGEKVFTSTARTTVSGVTVAGQPATIDENGISVAGNDDGGALNGALNETAETALEQAGITLRTIRPTMTATPDGVAGAASGVLLTFTQNVNQPVPYPASLLNRQYFGTVTIGGAGIRGFASDEAFGGDELPLIEDLSVDVAPPPPPPFEANPGLGSVAAPVAAGELAAGPAPQAAAPPSAAAARRAAVGVDLTDERIRWLALALLAYPLLVLLSAVARPPARLPGLR